MSSSKAVLCDVVITAVLVVSGMVAMVVAAVRSCRYIQQCRQYGSTVLCAVMHGGAAWAESVGVVGVIAAAEVLPSVATVAQQAGGVGVVSGDCCIGVGVLLALACALAPAVCARQRWWRAS